MKKESSECPLIPMGTATGKPSKETIRKTLQAFRDVGITQYLIYPRSGCEVEYLSDEWFDLCKNFLDEGKALGFTSFWLYDEFNWPSGQCAGKVMRQKKEYGAPYLSFFKQDGEYGWQKGYDPQYPNVLDPEAVRFFIHSTHDQYAERFGAEMGTLIKGIFTDEPSFMYPVDRPGNMDKEREILRIPYFDGLAEKYAERTGRSLTGDVISCIKNGSTRFYEEEIHALCGTQFKESYFDQVREWCAAHKLLLTGHLMDEYSTATSLRANGNPLKIIDSFHMPGMDEVGTRVSLKNMELITMGTVEHGIRANGNGGLAELFALGPCDMPLGKMRKMIRIVSMFGIDHYVLAVSQMDMRGNSIKTAWFNPYSPAQPWFEFLKLLGKDASYSASVAGRKFIPQIQIRFPGVAAPLNELLKQLTEAQRQWTLIANSEPGTADYILTFSAGGIMEEKRKRQWWNVSELIQDLDRECPQPIRVENPDGTRATALLMRIFADGFVELANISGNEKIRELVFCRNGQQIPFTLDADGVYSFPAWQVTIDRPNLKRIDLKNQRFEFTVEEDLPDCTLALRNYAGSPTLCLNGIPVVADRECDSLPTGFNNIYQESLPFLLARGPHTLEQKESLIDYPYLPLALLCGKFATDANTLRPYRNDGAGLECYSGVIIQEGIVHVPAGAARLCLDTDGLATKVFLNEECIGCCAWNPFEWRIPEHLNGGQVKVRIERYTSCGPMFGTEIFRQENITALPDYTPNKLRIHPTIEPRWNG